MWGLLSISFKVQTISEALGHAPQIVFSALVLLISIPACLGAMFFPKLGRLELFSSSSLAMLLAVYNALILIDVFSGNVDRLVSFVIVLSTLVVPISRAAFIYRTLTKQAKGKLWRS
jgi:hypothetical protein